MHLNILQCAVRCSNIYAGQCGDILCEVCVLIYYVMLCYVMMDLGHV
jgi:hypothetical protein